MANYSINNASMKKDSRVLFIVITYNEEKTKKKRAYETESRTDLDNTASFPLGFRCWSGLRDVRISSSVLGEDLLSSAKIRRRKNGCP